MKKINAVLAATCAAGLMFVSASAFAHPTFPDDIAAHLDVSCAPQCTLCHETAAGGGPVVTQFYYAMAANGFDATDDTIAPALDALKTKNIDSNCDGVSDVDSLTACEDPNANSKCPPDTALAAPDYGCSASPSSVAPTSAGAIIFALAFSIVRARRRKKVR